MNAECARCGVTAADLPYEELGLDLDDASEVLFESVDGMTVCMGCTQVVSPAGLVGAEPADSPREGEQGHGGSDA